MRAGAVGRVAFVPKSASNRPPTSEGGNEKSAPLQEPLKVGDWVSVISGWGEYAKVKAKDVQKIEYLHLSSLFPSPVPLILLFRSDRLFPAQSRRCSLADVPPRSARHDWTGPLFFSFAFASHTD